MITFAESMVSGTELPAAKAKILAGLIDEAFTALKYTVPRASTYRREDLPEKIFESKASESECNTTLMLNVTLAVSNLEELSSLNNSIDFYVKFKEFNYSVFIDDMITFVENFERCTSYYSAFIESMTSYSSYLVSITKRNISFGDTFIFEKESQVTDSQGCFCDIEANLYLLTHIKI